MGAEIAKNIALSLPRINPRIRESMRNINEGLQSFQQNKSPPTTRKIRQKLDREV
jgi:hypothetical protein